MLKTIVAALMIVTASLSSAEAKSIFSCVRSPDSMAETAVKGALIVGAIGVAGAIAGVAALPAATATGTVGVIGALTTMPVYTGASVVVHGLSYGLMGGITANPARCAWDILTE